MKILVISDVHANFEALKSVLQLPHDIVLFAGDIVATAAEQVEIKRIPYNINKTEKEIKETGLSKVLIDILKAE